VNDMEESTPSQSGRRLQEYVLLGLPDAVGTRTSLLLSVEYLLAVQPIFGFRPEEAAIAERVLIVGDSGAVSAATEADLLASGCEVVRVEGDSHNMEQLLRSRILEAAAMHSVRPGG